MDKLKEIYSYVLEYINRLYEHYSPYIVEAYNHTHDWVLANKVETLIILVILWMLIRIHHKRTRKLRKRKYKKARLASKKRFYGTGIKAEFCIWDIIKFKIRLGDYCDKKGIRYCYLFNIKLFGLELLRAKYIDQKGQVFKRKVTFRS